MTRKNLKQSFILLLATLLVDTGELLKEFFGYSEKKAPKDPPDVTPKQDAPELDTQTVTTTATNPQPTADTPPATSGAQVDQMGVPFDPITCGRAKEPFYGSGARAGQWKKRKGVTEEQYDAWYAKMLPVTGAPAADSAPTDDNMVAGQFGAPDPAAALAPTNLGEFMGWVAEMQTAGKVTPEMVNQAYLDNGISFADVNNPTTAATAISIMWNWIKARF